MNKELSTWNGYPVHGDVNELDAIVASTGFINLDTNDVVNVLSADGENWVTTGTGTNLNEAFNKAVDNLPCSIDKVNNLLIDFNYGSRQPDMAELSKISATLSEANTDIEIVWGITSDHTLEESYKVVLLASITL